VPRALPPEEVHLYCRLTESFGPDEIAAAVGLLSPEELTRYTRFMFDRDRRDYAVAHALLRESLSRYAAVPPREWEFFEDAGGKPALRLKGGTPRLSFNLSHTHGLVACAIAAGLDVGVDVEAVDRVVDSGVAERFFSARENAALRACGSATNRAARFFELWTLKESYVKALGKGLSHPLDTIAFDVGPGLSVAFLPPPGAAAASWQFALLAPTDRHRLAAAVRSDGPPVSIKLMSSE
jgi:4'-phosphopantetheinyl transferase